jgi:HEAT repeat protein
MSQNGANNPSDILVTSITELLIGPSPTQRAAAARTLGRTGNKFATSYLIQGLFDKARQYHAIAPGLPRTSGVKQPRNHDREVLSIVVRQAEKFIDSL